MGDLVQDIIDGTEDIKNPARERLEKFDEEKMPPRHKPKPKSEKQEK